MDLYQEVTARIIAELEKGAAPWIKPWQADSSADRNLVTDKPYRGINRLLLGMSSIALGYQSPIWATYKQYQEAGFQVSKGEKATHIVFFKPIQGKQTVREDGETELSAGYCVIRGYSVFNATQTNMPAPAPIVPDNFNPIPHCEEFINDTGAIISHGGDAAFSVSYTHLTLPTNREV